jgi:hypothetical protein
VDSGVKSLREEVSSLAKEIRLHLIDLSKRMDVLEDESSDEQTDATIPSIMKERVQSR